MTTKDYKVEFQNGDPGDTDLCFKLIIIGDSSVGKSCLALRAVKGTFESLYTPTVGFEFLTLYLKINNSNLKLQVWDTCGQEVYRSLIGSFYRNSSLALVLYSIDNENSFNNIESWLNELKSKGNPDINIFLIGNKADLEDKRLVSKEMANDLCDTHNIKYFLESSAKTGFNVKNIFIESAKVLYEQHIKYKDRISRPESIGHVFIDEGKKSTIESFDSMDETEDGKKEKKGWCCL
jgi:small GTP-binding protein